MVNQNFTIILFFLIILTACHDDNDSMTSSNFEYTASGFIYNSISGSSVDSAIIFNVDESIQILSTSTGYFEISGMHSGDYKLWIEKLNYHVDSLEFEIKSSDLTLPKKSIRPIGLFARTLCEEYSVKDTISLNIYNYTNKIACFGKIDFRLMHFVEKKINNNWHRHSSWTGGFNVMFGLVEVIPDSIYFEKYMLLPQYDSMDEGIYRLKFPYYYDEFSGINNDTLTLISKEFKVSL